MVEKKRAVIASGGTGGHFYPGFALAQELRDRGWQPLFLVKKEDIARPALEDGLLTPSGYIRCPAALTPRARFSSSSFRPRLALRR